MGIRRIFFAGAIVLATLGLAAPAASAGGVVTGPPGECGVIATDGSNFIGLGQSWLFPNGNTIVYCHATGVPNPTHRVQLYNAQHNPIGPGVEINCAGISTPTWWQVIGPRGEALLVCFGKP
jgi:hypothetical protein